MPANRKSLAANKTRKDILRFAPNFTAYVLPPDVVCLYSEDRKFFLHGELYCAVATAIGKNGKAAPEIVRQLSKSFPADKIEEAIKRLLERHHYPLQELLAPMRRVRNEPNINAGIELA